MTTREKIYTLLSESDQVLSGETISRQLGISRVSVWKHIQAMVKSGVPITSSPKGYVLASDEDSLSSLGFGHLKDQVHFYDEIPSTMDEAVARARQGCPDFTVVVAEKQTSGRGRMARSWVSDEGGLYFSIIARPALPIELAHLVNLAAALEMNTLLRSSYGIESWLKWPNDILVNGSKICGCLSQMEIEGGEIGFINIGIGLNVNNAPPDIEPAAVSMKQILGRSLARKTILLEFIDRFETRVEGIDPPALIEEWKEQNSTIGKQVSVVTRDKTFTGVAVDIDDQGGLVVAYDDGSRETVMYGDCFYNELSPSLLDWQTVSTRERKA